MFESIDLLEMCKDKNGQYIALYQDLSEDQMDEVIKIVTEFKRTDVFNGLNLSVSHITEYLRRGGKITVVENETIVHINPTDNIITGCNAGRCRSQATAGFLRMHGINVEYILAGRDSAINYSKNDPNLRNPVASELDALSFQEVFNCEKLLQVGFHLDEQITIEQAREYYSNFMKDLSNQTHFIVFGMCGPVVLLHLLNRTGSLEGFSITYFNWADTITHCREKHSVEAYESFVEQLKKHLNF